MAPDSDGPRQRSERFQRQVGEKALRRLKARREGDRSPLRGLAVSGMVGWSVVIPTLLGLALGSWIDRRFPGSYSWSLMLMLLGLALGCWNVWVWLQHHQDSD